MKRVFVSCFFITVIMALASGNVLPQAKNKWHVYYVSPLGSNSNNGTPARPWGTPGYASRRLRPGDTLIIKGGKYALKNFDDDIIMPQSGKAGAWITIKGEKGSRPILQGENNLACAIDISGKSYLRIENLEITNRNGAKFRDGFEALSGPIHDVVLQDLSIHHMDEFGINIPDAERLEIINVNVSYCGFGAVLASGGQHGGWSNVKVTASSFSYSGHYYQGKEGTRPVDRSPGFLVDSSAGPVEISNSKFEYNFGDGISSKAEKTNIHECMIANNVGDSVRLSGGGSSLVNTLIYGRGGEHPEGAPGSPLVIDSEKPESKFEIANITIDDLFGRNYLVRVQLDNPSVPIQLSVRNSIFCGKGENSGIFLAKAVNFVIENNLFYLPNTQDKVDRGDAEASNQLEQFGETNLQGDPLFVSSAAGKDGDYHLRNGSPAIDAGEKTGSPAIDLEGHPRPQGKGIDIGAYEQ